MHAGWWGMQSRVRAQRRPPVMHGSGRTSGAARCVPPPAARCAWRERPVPQSYSFSPAAFLIWAIDCIASRSCPARWGLWSLGCVACRGVGRQEA
jgi:hypothetical protein